jgi:hypothetical protein
VLSWDWTRSFIEDELRYDWVWSSVAAGLSGDVNWSRLDLQMPSVEARIFLHIESHAKETGVDCQDVIALWGHSSAWPVRVEAFRATAGDSEASTYREFGFEILQHRGAVVSFFFLRETRRVNFRCCDPQCPMHSVRSRPEIFRLHWKLPGRQTPPLLLW